LRFSTVTRWTAYVLARSSTLSAICLLFYGNANKYPQVAEAAGIDTDKIPVGKTLKLPALS
jgi:nucleoid-associated protein YgaU